MTTNGKRRDEGAAFRLRERDNSTRQRVRHCRKRKAGKTRDSTASTYQRLAKSRLDLSSKDGGRLMVGVSAGLGTRRGPPCGPCLPSCLRSLATTPGRQTAKKPRTPAQNTEKTENKSPATRSRGLFLENRTEPKHYRRP